MLRYYGRYLSSVFRGRSQPLLARGFSAVDVVFKDWRSTLAHERRK